MLNFLMSPFRVVVDAMRGIPAQLIDSGPFVSVQCPGEICFQPRDASGKHLLLPVHFADPLSYQSVACSLRDVIRRNAVHRVYNDTKRRQLHTSPRDHSYITEFLLCLNPCTVLKRLEQDMLDHSCVT